MNLAIIYSRASAGIIAPSVIVETHISNGLPKLSIVGLPETAVKESKDRVRSALLNTQFEFPCRRITVNLAPADLPKEGGRFDLPIALGILAASGQIPIQHLANYEFAGELALSGELRPIQGVLPFALASQRAQRILVIPYANVEEATLIKEIKVLPARHLLDVCAHITGKKLLESPAARHEQSLNNLVDLKDVKGQQQARRALEIAAAGGHSLLMIGPPGTGKTMLASRLPSIMPRLSEEEAITIASIYSISSARFQPANWRKRPFRSPHHTASSVALVGGGNPPQPGEISLAHHGVLFLDELPEFKRQVLEALREPLESGIISISRAARYAEYPAQFQLVAAMNPCPCGHLGNSEGECRCTSEQVQRYRARLSGPLLDRIDLHIEVPRLTVQRINSLSQVTETSEQVRQRVEAARRLQLQRSATINALLQGKELEKTCCLNKSDQDFLDKAVVQLGLSLRSYHKVLKIGRTIADLAASEKIETHHLKEALLYRKMDRKPSQ